MASPRSGVEAEGQEDEDKNNLGVVWIVNKFFFSPVSVVFGVRCMFTLNVFFAEKYQRNKYFCMNILSFVLSLNVKTGFKITL